MTPTRDDAGLFAGDPDSDRELAGVDPRVGAGVTTRKFDHVLLYVEDGSCLR